MSGPDNSESFKGKLGNINNTVEEFRSGCVPRGEMSFHSQPSHFLPCPCETTGYTFNLEAGSRCRKCILMLQPGPYSPRAGSAPWTSRALSPERAGAHPARQGAIPGGRRGLGACGPPPPSGPSRAGLRARPAGREDGHLAGGGPRSCGSGGRAARRPTPSDLTVAP